MTIRRPGDVGYDPQSAKQEGKEIGYFKGVVKDNDDPQKLGRIRVFMPQLMSGPETDRTQWSDWIEPASALGGKSDGSYGSLAVPDKGSLVWLTMELGDTDYPVYVGGRFDSNHVPPALARGEAENDGTGAATIGGQAFPALQSVSRVYPKNKVFKTECGMYVEWDDSTDGRLRLRHPSGTFIEIATNGAITIRSPQEDGSISSAQTLSLGGESAVQLLSDVIVRLGTATASHPVPHGDTLLTQLNVFKTAVTTFATACEASSDTTVVLAATALKLALNALVFNFNSTRTVTE